MCGVFGIGGERSEDVRTCFCGTDSTVSVIVGEAMVKGSEVGKN